MSYFASILFNARQWPDKAAVVLRDRVITYGALGNAILSAAAVLQARGVKPGQIVGVVVDTPSWNLILNFALAHIGATACSMNTIADAKASGVPFHLIITRRPPDTVSSFRVVQMEDGWFVHPGRPVNPAGFPDPDSVCRLALSSGTTGLPKVISFTRRAIEDRQMAWTLAFNHTPWDRMLLLIGVTTNFAFGAALMALNLGRALVFGRDPDESVRLAALFRVDSILGSNAHLETFVAALDRTGILLPDVRHCHFGGSKTTPTLASAVLSRVSSNACVGYGSTENGITAFGPLRNLDIEGGAVGRVAPWGQMQIVNDDGVTLPPGAEGIVRTRTNGSGRPYGPQADREPNFDAEGWHYPGDIGRIDETGMLYITGRADHLINAGGVKMAPEVIEDQVRFAPGVREVAATMLEGGDIWLVAAADATREAILGWCSANMARPKISGVALVPELPRTINGKIRREAVRTLATEASTTEL